MFMMMKRLTILIIIGLFAFKAKAQSNISVSNLKADSVMKGLFDPVEYQASTVIDDSRQIIQNINSDINPDTLKAILFKLSEFGTRHTSSDTVSDSIGIGAARRWIHSKMQSYSAQNENRLLVSYLDFDLDVCGFDKHKNVLAVLPGRDTANHRMIFMEAHMDSRCDDVCDTACTAEGVEDNASGTALVMELARVMSQFTFDNTMVFMLTTGEEQGLLGADAMASYADSLNLPIRCVLNNDIVGGIICGQTSSAPSCPGLNHIDSTQVRLFSFGGVNSKYKAFSRYIKIQYEDELKPIVSVPMALTVMSAEDRSGRGGDHIPFRQRNYTAMRFTSANEHGNANAGPGYTDRQHTSDDILGIDTDNDNVIDSFFVDFNYLARNAVINGTIATTSTIAPAKISINASVTTGNYIKVNITNPQNFSDFKVGIRTMGNDFDSLYSFSGLSDSIPSYGRGFYYVSACAVDANGFEGYFSNEVLVNVQGVGLESTFESDNGIQLLQNRPNPFDEATIISCYAEIEPEFTNAKIHIRNLKGELLESIPFVLKKGMNEVLYTHGYNMEGTLLYSLELNGKILDSKRMLFAF